MKIAILGFDRQGRSAFDHWNHGGNTLVICDRNESLSTPDGVETQLGEGYLNGLDRFDVLVRTPGLHPRDILAANPDASRILEKVTTNTNEFLRVCPTRNIIGVTGTKGKGTTSTLITKMLEAAGLTVHLGGNIGTPPLDLLGNGIKPGDLVVLELANFQLIDLKYSPRIAVCLMVEPEHQDWHTDMAEYVTAKTQLFRWQKADDVAVYYSSNDTSARIASASPGVKLPYMAEPGAHIAEDKVVIGNHEICTTSEVKLLGKHNLQNICAAVTAVWQVTQDAAAIRGAITSFTGLEHRLEFVRDLDGVSYYDDSFGTTPQTTIVAIEAFTQPIVLILGGSDKGAEFDELAKAVTSGNVRAVLTIGVTAPAIETALRAQGYSAIQPGGTTMPDIIATARAAAKPGDIVLLSTGCASFGLFKDYYDRGDQFKRVVQALK